MVEADTTKVLTMEEARHVAANITKLSDLLMTKQPD